MVYACSYIVLQRSRKCGTADASHRATPAYSLASYQGDYAVIGTYGQNVARLIGTYHADGKGNVGGTARVNLPAPAQRVGSSP